MASNRILTRLDINYKRPWLAMTIGRIFHNNQDLNGSIALQSRRYSSGFVTNRFRQFRGDDNFLTRTEATAFVMQLHNREREVLLRSLLPVVSRKPGTIRLNLVHD